MVHIAGSDNIEADHESRIKANIEWELPQKDFERLSRDLGSFEIYLFASMLAHKLYHYASGGSNPFPKHIDALSFDWCDSTLSLLLVCVCLLVEGVTAGGTRHDADTLLDCTTLAAQVAEGGENQPAGENNTTEPDRQFPMEPRAWTIYKDSYL